MESNRRPRTKNTLNGGTNRNYIGRTVKIELNGQGVHGDADPSGGKKIDRGHWGNIGIAGKGISGFDVGNLGNLTAPAGLCLFPGVASILDSFGYLAFLCPFLFVLGLVVILYMLFQYFFQPPSNEGKKNLCGRCGQMLPKGVIQCPLCGKFHSGVLTQTRGELQTALRAVRKLSQTAGLGQEHFLLTIAALENRLREINENVDPFLSPVREAPLAELAVAVPLAPVEEKPPPLPAQPSVEIIPFAEAVEPVAAPPIPIPMPSLAQEVETFAVVEPPPPATMVKVQPPTAPKEKLSKWMGAFMESHNILLGEILGGLLIVGGAMALVATLWGTLEKVPYFPFLLLGGIAGLMFLAGEYTLHRWRLETTSRGMLVISLLLLPITFLVLGNLGSEAGGSLVDGVVQAAALVAGGLLCRRGLIDVFRREGNEDASWEWLIFGGQMLPCFAMLAVSWFRPLGDFSASLAGLALAVGASGILGARAAKSPANSLLAGGLSFFTLAAAEGFLAGSMEKFHLPVMALPLALSALPLLVSRGKETVAGDPYHIGRLGLLGLGSCLIGLAPVFAWPRTDFLLFCLAGTIPVLAWTSWRNCLYSGTLAACLHFFLVAALLAHWLAGSLTLGETESWELARKLLENPSGLAMALPAMALSVLAFRFKDHLAIHPWTWGAWAGMALGTGLVWHQQTGPGYTGALTQIIFALGSLLLHFGRPQGWSGVAFPVLLTLGLYAGLKTARWPDFQLATLSGAAALFVLVPAWFKVREPGLKTLLDGCRAVGGLLLPLSWLATGEIWKDYSGAGVSLALGLQSLALFTLALDLGKRELGQAGMLLAGLSGWHLFAYQTSLSVPVAAGILTMASVALMIRLGGASAPYFDPKREEGLEDPSRQAQPLLQFGVLTLLMILTLFEPFFSTWRALGATALSNSIYLAWSGVLFFGHAALEKQSLWFRWAQVCVTAAVAFGALAWVQGQDWFKQSGSGYSQPAVFHALGCSLAGLTLAWGLVRLEARNWPLFRSLWFDGRRSVDEWLLAGHAGALLGLTVYCGYLLTGSAWHGWLEGVWAWEVLGQWFLIWGAIALTGLLIYLWEEGSLPRLELFYLMLGTGFTLAGIYASARDVPAGMALGLTLWFLAGAVLLHFRERAVSFAAHLGVRVMEGDNPAKMLRWNLAGAALLALFWLAWEDCTAFRAGEGFHEKIQQAGGWLYTGAYGRHWAGAGLVLAGLILQAVKEKNERFLFLGGLTAMLALGGSYLRWLSDAGHLDIGGVVLFPQMMAVAGGLWLAAWAWSGRFLKMNESEYPWLGGLTVAACGAAAIVPGVVTLNWTSHPWTAEAGALTGFLMLGCVFLGGASMAFARAGFLHYRGLFLAGFAILATLACKREHDPGEGTRFLMAGGGLYLLLWPWGYLVAKKTPPRLWRLDFSNPRELAGLIQGFGLFLLFLIAWCVWFRDQSGPGLLGLGAMLATAVALAWFRASDRQAAVAFWLALGFGALWALEVEKTGVKLQWPSAWVFGALAMGGATAALWGKMKSWSREWAERRSPSHLEIFHGHFPLIALLFLIVPLGIAYVSLGPVTAVRDWIGELSARRGMFALLFGWLAAWKCREKYGLGTALPWTGAALALGLATALIEGDRGGAFADSLLTMGITWALFSLAISLAGVGLRFLKDLNQWVIRLADADWLACQGLLLTAGLGVAWKMGLVQEGEAWRWFPLVLLASLQSLAVAAWKSHLGFGLFGLALNLLWGMLVCWFQPSLHAMDFVLVAGMVLGASALEWHLLGLLPGETQEMGEKLGRWAGLAGVVVLFAGALAAYAFALFGQLVPMELRLAWWAVAILAAAALLPLAKGNARFATGWLFLLALATIEFYFRQRGWVNGELIRATPLPLALLLFTATGLAWVFFKSEESTSWLESAHAMISGVIVIVGYWIVWTGEIMEDRLPGLAAVALAVPSAYFLARAIPSRGQVLRLEFLFGVFLALTLLFQSASIPHEVETWPNRAVLFQTSTLAAGLLAFLFSNRLGASWEFLQPILQRLLPGLAFLSLLLVILVEAAFYDAANKQTHLSPWAFWLGFAGALLFALASCLRGLLLPPERAGLNNWRNTKFLWAAIGVSLLVFMHIRLCKPEWFHGWIGQYWSVGAMALAFILGGAGEFLCRRGKMAVADPLLKVGAVLPLAPLAAFWLGAFTSFLPGFLKPLAESASRLPGDFGNHAFLWFLTAMLWGWVAMQRQSAYLALASLVAVNAAFWTLWKDQGLEFLARPQMWLIPPALTMLLLEQSRKDQIRPDVARFLRYFGLSLIYVSSTTELIREGIGHSIWLPVVLAIWCVGGILIGMMLRLRGFLAFGFAFLILDLALMVWHLAMDRGQTWVWWICLIVLGALVLALFTFFEKHREKVKQIVSDLKKWD